MRRAREVVAPLVAWVTVVVASPPALPCSWVIPSLESMRLSVDDGAMVPPNFVLFGAFIGDPAGASWSAIDADGNATDLAVEVEPELGWSRLTPASPLAPGTTYQLTAFAPDGSPSSERDPVTVTAGDQDDLTAPDAPTVAQEIEATPPILFSSCGDSLGGTLVTFSIEPLDDVGVYRLSNRAGDVIRVDFAQHFARDPNDPVFFAVIEEKGGDEEYAVVAIDQAGNESVATLLLTPLGCPGSCAGGDLSVAGGLSALLLLLLRRAVKTRR